MGFLDKAKAAAMDLQQKADAAMANSGMMGGSPMGGGPMGGGGMPGGPADRLLRDLGVLTYLNAMGRPGSAEDYQRVMEQLRSLESSGGLNLSLSPAAPPGYGAPGAPPPPPGAVAAAAAAASAAPPPPVAAPPPAAPMPAPVGDAPMGGYAAPPPPPVPSPAADAGETGAAAADEANGPGAEGTAYPDPTFDETPNGDVLADSTIVDVQEQITDLGGGGGTAPPPPPPSWA